MNVHQLVIVGAGPAGLALAQYAATRGYEPLILERSGCAGGRARTSPLLENVPGFPDGIPGRVLADKLLAQSLRLGADIRFGREVALLKSSDEHVQIVCSDGEKFLAKEAVLACGLTPRRGSIAGVKRRKDVHYEPPAHYEPYRRKSVVVYGGGNAAGQTALAFSRQKECIVELVIPDAKLRDSMAAYLAERIEDTRQIRVHFSSAVESVEGEDYAAAVSIQRVPYDGISGLFVLLGGEPSLSWLAPEIEQDEKGYILSEAPHYETTMARVYAIGDICSGRGHTVMASYGDAARVLERIQRS